MGNFDPEEISVGPKSSLIVVVVTLILGAGAAALAIIAMLSSPQNPYTPPEANVSVVLNCNYQTSTASMFGKLSGLVLSIALAMISVLGGCVCCVTMQYSWGQALKVSIVCYTLAWASFFVAEVCVMGGAYINQYYVTVTNYQYDIQLRTCYQTKSMAFLVGAITCVTTVLFSVLYYGQAQKSKYEAWVEQGAPTPRLYSLETMKSFVIAGPAKAGPLKTDEDDDEDGEEEEEDDYDVFDEGDSMVQPLNRNKRRDDDDE